MRNKNGFTLVELLAVIIILGVLVAIAVPAYSRYVDRSETKYYKSLESTVRTSGMEFVTENPEYLPKTVGTTAKILKGQIISNGIMDSIQDSDGKDCTTATIVIKKTANGEYEYTTCLVCGKYKTDNTICS